MALIRRSLLAPIVVFIFYAANSNAAEVNAERITGIESEPENWLSHGRGYSEQRYSPLDSISEGTVKKLGLAWFTETGSNRGLEATPLVVDGVMYLTLSWSVMLALDAATGQELWRFDPKVDRARGYYACCDVVNRGAAVWGDKVYFGAFDGRLIAVDAKSGQLVWQTETVDISQPYSITGAPRIVKGKVIIGNGGADFGVRGYVSAYDAVTGRLLWRFHTVPGNPDKGFENDAMETAADTWNGQWWTLGGGGTVWDSMAYDPDLDLLYIGVGNGSPWNAELRSPGGGDNLFLSSIVALKPEDGRYVWHYQTTPAEQWDYTATQHIMLADIEIDSERRKVLMQAPKNGFFYVIDRATGQLISAEPYARVNWASHIDMETGRPVRTEKADYLEKPRYILPSQVGAHNWHPMSYDPRYGLVFIPVIEQGYRFKADSVFKPTRSLNTGLDLSEQTPPPGMLAASLRAMHHGSLLAWDPLLQKARWRVDLHKSWVGGTLATAGNLVFMGHPEGILSAYRSDIGEEVWRANTQVGVMAPPISYAVNGEQYIAVAAGWGGSMSQYSGPERDQLPASNGRVLAYKLGGKQELPAMRPVPELVLAQEPVADNVTLEEGERLYSLHCGRCHGFGAASHSSIADLRFLSREKHRDFDAIVRGGLYADRGMAAFNDLLSTVETESVRQYILSRAKSEQQRRNAPDWWQAVKRWFFDTVMPLMV
ncbi:MAG: PQQ-dependent dehydrogenase, methanol/ethanol family [Pseudomonadales bacterium]